MMIDKKLQPLHKDRVLAEIRKKEAWAKDFLMKSRDESKKYILSAVARAEEIRKRGKAEIDVEIQRLREAHQIKLENELAVIESEMKKRIEEINALANSKIETTIEFVLKCMLEELNA